MEPISETYVDKSKWPPGVWRSEPDRVEWRSVGTPRLPCLIVRGGSGALCGYVGVPPGHPWHGLGGSEAYRLDVNVHGGVTYGSACQEGGKICHVARTGEPDDVWWIGFDCSHAGDISPSYGEEYIAEFQSHGDSYKSLGYVRREVESLAVQAQRVAKGFPAYEED